jgi:isocitrate dehydrogenase (NAD+)
MYTITLIPGDGIGPEVSDAAVRCIEATGVKICWETVIAGQAALDKFGDVLPRNVIDSINKNKVALKGPITTPIGSGFRSVNVAIRHAAGLYACVRPAKTYAGVKSPFKGIDLLIVRENSEDLYAGIEFEQGKPETREIVDAINSKSKKRSAMTRAFRSNLSQYRLRSA